MERLSSPAAAERAHAVQDLALAPLLGEQSTAAFTRVVELAADPDPVVRASVAEAISHLAGGKPEAARPLTQLLRDETSAVRLAAVRALDRIGPAGIEAVPALVERLADQDPAIRRETARALGRVGGARVDQAVAALADLLRTATDPGLREEAAHALAEAGHSSAAVSALLEALRDAHYAVRREAVHALGFMPASHADHVLPALRIALEDQDDAVGAEAVRAAARLGEPAVGLLIDALQNKAWLVRWWAALSLGDIGLPARSAIAALQRAAQDERPGVREAAVGALRKIDPGAVPPSPSPSPSPSASPSPLPLRRPSVPR